MKRTIHIYSDESRQRNEKFFLLGGLWVDEKNVKDFEIKMKLFRSSNGYINDDGDNISFLGELKWTKVSKKYLGIYKAFVDLFFELNEKDTIRFNVMLVNTLNGTIKSHNNLDGEGFYKLYYQLYLHKSLIPAEYRIFPDRIRNKDNHNINFERVKKSLSYGFANKFVGKVNPIIFKDMKFVKEIRQVDSKKVDFIQMTDVLLGAIGYFQNRHFENKNRGEAKFQLMKYVIDKLIYSGCIKFDGKKYMVTRSKQFNIWVFKPKKILEKTKNTTNR